MTAANDDSDRKRRGDAAPGDGAPESAAADDDHRDRRTDEGLADSAATGAAAADSIAEPAATAEEATAEAAAVEEEAPAGREAELEAEVAELKERLLRALAETENLRRRTQRDVEDARKYAVTGFARALLDVADNLGRALQSIPEEARAEAGYLKTLAEGVEMTERALYGTFERHGIRKVEPQPGEKFDHNRHQAMFEVETADHPPGTVAQVLQDGYVIEDRLLRPAMVGVAKAKPEAAGGTGAAEEPPAERQGLGGEARPGERVDTTA